MQTNVIVVAAAEIAAQWEGYRKQTVRVLVDKDTGMLIKSQDKHWRDQLRPESYTEVEVTGVHPCHILPEAETYWIILEGGWEVHIPRMGWIVRLSDGRFCVLEPSFTTE